MRSYCTVTYLRYAVMPLDFNQNQKASQWAAQSSRPSSLSSEFFCKHQKIIHKNTVSYPHTKQYVQQPQALHLKASNDNAP